jgi:hypothetical protein
MSLRGRSLPGETPSGELSTQPRGVNADLPNARAEGAAPRRGRSPELFCPWGRLIQRLSHPSSVQALGLSDCAHKLLEQCLWRSGKQGDTRDPECGPAEAIFWRELGGLATDLRKSTGSIKRALRELREGGLVRWRRVEPFGRLPSGIQTSHGHAVYYVAIGVIRQRLGVVSAASGTERGGEINHDPSGEINHDPSGEINHDPSSPDLPESVLESDAASSARVSLSVVKSVVKNHKQQTNRNPAHPSPCGSADADGVVARLFATWWDAIGQHRPEYSAAIGRRVRRGLVRAVSAGHTEPELADAIAGASDPKLGGAAYAKCRKWNVWHGNLFWNEQRNRPCESIGHLCAAVAKARAAELAAERARARRAAAEAARRAAPTAPENSPRGGTGRHAMSEAQTREWCRLVVDEGLAPAEASARVWSEAPKTSVDDPDVSVGASKSEARERYFGAFLPRRPRSA